MKFKLKFIYFVFAYEYLLAPVPFVEKGFLPALNYLCSFVKKSAKYIYVFLCYLLFYFDVYILSLH